MIHFRIRYEGLRGRLGSVRRRAGLVRAAWLALLAPLGGLALFVAGRGPLAPGGWWLAAAAVFGGAAAWLLRPAAPGAVDRDLDRRFGLNELLVTAVEVDRRGVRSPIETRLLDDAALAVSSIGDDGALDGLTPRREAETLAALAMVLAGLWLLAGTLAGPPDTARLPDLGPPTADGTGAEDGGDAAGSRGAGASPELGLMAGALVDHAAARDIADALAAGNPAAAARAARALADRADGLSSTGRDALAETLSALGDDLDAPHPDLARALDEAARALRAGGRATPGAGIEGLAEQLDSLAGGALATPHARTPRMRDGPPAARLVVIPTPMALATTPVGAAQPRVRGRAADPAAIAGSGLAADETTGGGTASVAGAARAAIAGTAGDPLRYPWPFRDTVRQYFTPAERRGGGDGG